MDHSRSPKRTPQQDFDKQKLQTELDHCRNELIVADQKLSVLNDVKQDLVNARRQLHEREHRRHDLHHQLQDKEQDVAEHRAEQQKLFEVINRENDNLKGQINHLAQHNADDVKHHKEHEVDLERRNL